MTEQDFERVFEKLPNKPLLRIGEVATFFQVSKKTIYAWYPEHLNGMNCAGIIRIYRESVVKFVMENSNKKASIEEIDELKEVAIESDISQKGSRWLRKWQKE